MDINPKPLIMWDGAPLQHCPFDPRCECSALSNDPTAADFRRPRPYDGHMFCTCDQTSPRPVMQWTISVRDWLCRNCGRRGSDPEPEARIIRVRR